MYIDEKVVQLYSTLPHDDALRMLIADVTVEVCGEPPISFELFGTDVVKMVQRIFQLPIEMCSSTQSLILCTWRR